MTFPAPAATLVTTTLNLHEYLGLLPLCTESNEHPTPSKRDSLGRSSSSYRQSVAVLAFTPSADPGIGLSVYSRFHPPTIPPVFACLEASKCTTWQSPSLPSSLMTRE